MTHSTGEATGNGHVSDSRMRPVVPASWVRRLPDSAPALLAFVLVALWVVLAGVISYKHPVIRLSDVFGFIERAESLSFAEAAPWVDGFYPFGYPVLLRVLFELTGNYLLAARVISLFAATLLLVAIYRLGTAMKGPILGIVAVLLLGLDPVFIRWATSSGTDMLATMLFGAALAAAGAGRLGTGRILAAGALLGAAYMVRYTAIVALPAFCLWLGIVTLREGGDRLAVVLKRVALLLLSFAAVAAPQFLMSWHLTGNPLWNSQATNVYFGIFGDRNWGAEFAEAREQTSLLRIVVGHPVDFAKNFVDNLILSVQVYPFQALGWLGAFHVVSAHFRARPGAENAASLLLVFLVSFTAAVSIAFVDSRLLLPVLPVLALLTAVVLFALLSGTVTLRENLKIPPAPFVIGLIVLVLLKQAMQTAVFHVTPAWQQEIIDSARFLDGLDVPPDRVLSLSFNHYDVFSPTKDRYPIDWYRQQAEREDYSSFGAIHERMREDGYGYLLLDGQAPRNVPGLDDDWPASPKALDPYFEEVADFGDTVILKPR